MKRAEKLEPQEQQELEKWIQNILLTICKGEDDRIDELLASVNDMELQDKLLKEYKL